METILKNVGTEFGAGSNSTSCWLEYFRKKYPIQTNEIFITLDGKFNTLKLNLGLNNGILSQEISDTD